jgi:hypothetical protein
MYKVKFSNRTYTLDLNFFQLIKKKFGYKFKTEVKKVEIKNEEKQVNEKKIILKPNFNKLKNSNSSINLMSKLEDKKLKSYYNDLRRGIMNFEDPPSNRMYLWYGAHLIPAVIFINQLHNFIWVYQIFWITTSFGLVYSTYELYSSEKEKKIMDNHVIIGYLLIFFIIVLAVLLKYSNSQEIKNLVYSLNSLNFLFVYFLFTFNKRNFYIPKHLKKSMNFLILFLGILSFISIPFQNKIILKDDDNKGNNFVITQSNLYLINIRYLKELSSK